MQLEFYDQGWKDYWMQCPAFKVPMGQPCTGAYVDGWNDAAFAYIREEMDQQEAMLELYGEAC